MKKRPADLPAELKLLSAALRHLRDAEHLADASNLHGSLDQAYHLAGFGPDCRYQATGTYPRSQTEPLLREAWLAATEIMAAMWADGHVALESLR